MSGATLRRFASSPLGMHSQLHDNETSKPLGVVLEPEPTLLPAGHYRARPCPAGVLIEAGRRAPLAMRDCTEPHARGDILIGAQIAKAEGETRRVIAGRAEAFDRFVASLAGEMFDITVVDPGPDPDDPFRAPCIKTPFDP